MSIVTFKRGDTFPSPCGDKLKYVKSVSYLMKYEVFPSPCGDKLKYLLKKKRYFTMKFPSPYGATPLYHGGGKIEIPFQGEP